MKKRSLFAAVAAISILLTSCSRNPAEESSGTTSSGETSSSAAAEDNSGSSATETEPEIPSEEPASTDPFVPTEETVEPVERPETTVQVDYDTIDHEEGALDEFNVTDDESCVHVLFTASEPVTDFKVLYLTCEDIDDNGSITFSFEELYSQPELTPERPLAAGMVFLGEIPNNGISYVDPDGVTRRFAVDMSGRDGSLFLWEF